MAAGGARRERIAIVTTSYPRHTGDAAGHFVASEAQRLASSGHRVTVLAPGRFEHAFNDGARGDGARGDIELRPIADRGAFGWPGALARLRERPLRVLGACEFVLRATHDLATSGPFDRVIAHFLVPAGWPIASRALARSATALDVVCHGTDVRFVAGLPGPLRRRIVADLLERGARFRFVSAALRDELARATLPELLERASVEPSPIDLSGAPSRARARDELGLGANDAIALVVARLLPDKRVAHALTAIALIPELSAVVVGDGPLRDELSRRFPKVRFAGQLPRPECLRWIAAADVLVSASTAEGAPTAIREARALNVPVAAVPAGDLESWAATDAGICLSARR